MGLTSKYLIPNVTPANLVSQDKTKNLYKMQNVSANNKIFDKDLKSKLTANSAYVYDFNAPSAKITFPK